MEKKSLKNVLEIFLTLQVTKELPRQGFLYSGFKRNEADSVAAHSFSVAAFSYLFSRELKSNGIDSWIEEDMLQGYVEVTGEFENYAYLEVKEIKLTCSNC